MRFKILLLAGLALSQVSGVAVFPPMIQGFYLFKVQPTNELDVDLVPLFPMTRSIGIIHRDGGPVLDLGCTDTPDQMIVYEISAKVSATGNREAFKAHAFDSGDCQGLASGPSDNTGYTYPGKSPREPDLS